MKASRTCVLVAAIALSACAQQGVSLETADGTPPDLARPPADVTAAQYGALLLKDGQPEIALKAFRLSLIEEGTSVMALAGMGAANRELGRLKQAKKILSRAAEIYPESPVVRNNLGVVLYDLGDYPGARRQFEAAFALASGAEADIEHNIGITMNSEERQAIEDPTPVHSPFTVIPLGNGQYYLLKKGEASI